MRFNVVWSGFDWVEGSAQASCTRAKMLTIENLLAELGEVGGRDSVESSSGVDGEENGSIGPRQLDKLQDNHAAKRQWVSFPRARHTAAPPRRRLTFSGAAPPAPVT